MDDLSLFTFNAFLPSDIFDTYPGVLNETEMRFKFISYYLPPFFFSEDSDNLILDSPYVVFEVFDAAVDQPLTLSSPSN
jgi:hypothetical protein